MAPIPIESQIGMFVIGFPKSNKKLYKKTRGSVYLEAAITSARELWHGIGQDSAELYAQNGKGVEEDPGVGAQAGKAAEEAILSWSASWHNMTTPLPYAGLRKRPSARRRLITTWKAATKRQRQKRHANAKPRGGAEGTAAELEARTGPPQRALRAIWGARRVPGVGLSDLPVTQNQQTQRHGDSASEGRP